MGISRLFCACFVVFLFVVGLTSVKLSFLTVFCLPKLFIGLGLFLVAGGCLLYGSC